MYSKSYCWRRPRVFAFATYRQYPAILRNFNLIADLKLSKASNSKVGVARESRWQIFTEEFNEIFLHFLSLLIFIYSFFIHVFA